MGMGCLEEDVRGLQVTSAEIIPTLHLGSCFKCKLLKNA